MKTDQEIFESSMAEDDPRVVCVNDEKETKDPQRWGRNHKGAKILANFYSRGNFKFIYYTNIDRCLNMRSRHQTLSTHQTLNYNSSAIINLLSVI